MDEILYMLLSVFGFVSWAYFQYCFAYSANQSLQTRLLFPIIVPFLAVVFVFIGYVFKFNQIPWALTQPITLKNSVFILIASLGLALGYFFYMRAISISKDNAILIAVFNVVIVTLLFFVSRYDNGKIKWEFRASLLEKIGVGITIVGVIIMKWGVVYPQIDKLIKQWQK